MTDNKILDVTADVKWIGVLDADLRTFDIVMETKYGTTYNSYFINAKKKAIVETVKAEFWDVYLKKLKTLVKPEEIEYIIINHTEPDHSGCLENLLKIAPKAKVVGSGNTIRFLNDLLGFDFPSITIKDDQTLDLGDKTIRFIGAANLHWPDSTYSYLLEDKVLFTCDSFGAHYCHDAMFDDLVGNFDDAFKYYFDVILAPYSRFMLRAIDKIRPLDINAICTGHGPILRKDWKKYVDWSEELSRKTFTLCDHHTVFVPYVSAYGKTTLIAEKLAEGIRKAGEIEVNVCDIEKWTMPQMEEHILKSNGILIGSPTINKNTFFQIYQLLALINPIRDKGKLAAVFGSYGWSGEVFKIIRDNLSNLKLKMFEEDFTVKFVLHEKDFDKCISFGERFGKKLLSNNILEE
jgi:flavorubredoxin